ncbi:unnamed protein product [Pleuronectes platessa]|uniref:Uncharacterized protein n=1 Tax=Pleuronectes platessa TaxID=8262 RepID=A0A9N7Z293_PLEPL|nr:unnamed protein product [Pleuronectes platessa]
MKLMPGSLPVSEQPQVTAITPRSLLLLILLISSRRSPVRSDAGAARDAATAAPLNQALKLLLGDPKEFRGQMGITCHPSEFWVLPGCLLQSHRECLWVLDAVGKRELCFFGGSSRQICQSETCPPRVSDLWLPPHFLGHVVFRSAAVINGCHSMSWGLVKSEQKSWEGKDTWEKCFHPFSVAEPCGKVNAKMERKWRRRWRRWNR